MKGGDKGSPRQWSARFGRSRDSSARSRGDVELPTISRDDPIQWGAATPTSATSFALDRRESHLSLGGLFESFSGVTVNVDKKTRALRAMNVRQLIPGVNGTMG